MKREVAAIMVVFMFILAGASYSDFDTDSSAKPMLIFQTTDRPSVGHSFKISAVIQNVSNLSGFEFDVRYNQSYLDVVSVSEGTFLSSYGNTYWMGANTLQAGVIKEIVCVLSRSGGKTGSGTLVEIVFSAKVAGTCLLSFENVGLSDQNGMKILNNITNSSVVITSSPAWDVNSDGRVDIFDFVIVGQKYGQYISGNPVPNPDVNRDGRVNISDLVLVGQHYGDVYWSPAPSMGAIIPDRAALIVARDALLENGDDDMVKIVDVFLDREPRRLASTWAEIKGR